MLSLLSSMGLAAGLVYALLLPLVLVQLFAMLFIAGMQQPGAKPLAVGKAIYCGLLQLVGVGLMSVGGVMALHAVAMQMIFSTQQLSTQMYLALLFVFAAGGLTFLWHERMAATIDDTSAKVPLAITWFTIKTMGYLLMLVSALAILLTFLLADKLYGTWSIFPGLLFVHGLFLSFATRSAPVQSGTFHTSPMFTPGNGMGAVKTVKIMKMVSKGKKKK